MFLHTERRTHPEAGGRRAERETLKATSSQMRWAFALERVKIADSIRMRIRMRKRDHKHIRM